MFFNFKVCLTTCFCTLKEIRKWVPMKFHETKKLLQMVSHDLWARNRKIVIHGCIVSELRHSIKHCGPIISNHTKQHCHNKR